jgi:hypothetical protein
LGSSVLVNKGATLLPVKIAAGAESSSTRAGATLDAVMRIAVGATDTPRNGNGATELAVNSPALGFIATTGNEPI